jgi:hypothetical protein
VSAQIAEVQEGLVPARTKLDPAGCQHCSEIEVRAGVPMHLLADDIGQLPAGDQVGAASGGASEIVVVEGPAAAPHR